MPREIDDDETVTQYGNLGSQPPFRAGPRNDSPRPRAMSVTLGRRSASDMAVLVHRSPDPRIDTVRYARVGRLRSAGFAVVHRPSRRNPDHASVEWPGTWDDGVAERFDACFEGHDG